MLGKSIAGASTSERRTIEQHNNGQAGRLVFIIYFTGNVWVIGFFLQKY